jgi:S-adenosylmethionine:tRNA ribosyltransferase-isomerase
MDTARFDYHLPPERIAQEPLPERDAARLLVLDRATRTWTDRHVRDLPDLLRPGDLLVLNDTRVIPARLRATRDLSGGKIEFLLLPPGPADTETERHGDAGTRKRVLMKSGGRLRIGETFTLHEGLQATLRERCGEAGDVVDFHCSAPEFSAFVLRQGEVPLPPYIHRAPGPSMEEDRERYQTVFAETPGAVAAPTAGLHFSERLLAALAARGVQTARLTLHVGPGTFRPVKADQIEKHFVDPEPYFIPEETVRAVCDARRAGRRVIAVGTTSLRTLEGSRLRELLAGGTPPSGALSGETNLFVYPPREFAVADALLTNFHLPKSSLLMLVSAFAAPGSVDGIDLIQKAYAHAVASGYRFYSYGDACLIE